MSAMKLTPLGDIADLQAGVGFPLDMQGRDSGDYPLAKVGDISRVARSGQTTMFATNHYVDEEDLPRLKAKPIPAGSILFSKIGEAIRQNHRVIAGCPLLIDNNAMAAIPNARVESRFLYHVLRTVDFYALASATTVPALRKSVLERLPVPLPPLPEQRQIAEILDKADALRARRRAALAQLDTITQSIFLDMFGDPAMNPKGWPRLRLVDLCSAADDIKCGPFGTQLAQSEYTTEGVPLWGIRHVNAFFRLPTQEFLEQRTANRLSKYTIEPGDIVMTRKGTIGNCAVYPANLPPGVMHSDLLRLRLNPDRCEPKFIAHQLHFSRDVERQLALISGGAIMPGINVTKLKTLEVFVPPASLQSDFERRAAAIDGVQSIEEGSSDTFNALFASLQYRAFRGEL